MPQSEQFVCITYPKIDFLIPNNTVISSVGVKDLNISLLHNENSGFFDFDEIASQFKQSPRKTEIKTLIVVKGFGENHLSIVTTQECSLNLVNLEEFGLFSEYYAEQFQKLGFLACSFKDNRLRLIMDVKSTIKYMNDFPLEEL